MDHPSACTVRARRRAAAVVGVGAGTLAAASCLALAALGDTGGAHTLASAAVGVLSLLGSAVLLALGRDAGRLPRFRRWGATTALLYGAGMVVGSVESAGSSTAATPLGSLLSLAAVPCTVAMLIALPRPVGSAGRPARLLADAVVVAASGAVVLWQVGLVAPGVTAGNPPEGALFTVGLGLIFIGYLTGLAVVGHDRHVLLILLGYVGLVAGDLATTGASLSSDESLAWLPTVTMCGGVVLLWVGLLLVSGRPTTPATTVSRSAEARSSLSTVLVLSCAAAAVVLASFDRVVDGVGRGLLGSLVVAVLVREVVVQRQRMRDLEMLRHLAEHDALTGAGNRRALSRVLSRAVPGPTDRPLVVVLDLDGFTAINDRYGPCVGDALLCAVVEALGGVEPEGTQVFRLGADDFAVLVAGARGGARAAGVHAGRRGGVRRARRRAAGADRARRRRQLRRGGRGRGRRDVAAGDPCDPGAGRRPAWRGSASGRVGSRARRCPAAEVGAGGGSAGRSRRAHAGSTSNPSSRWRPDGSTGSRRSPGGTTRCSGPCSRTSSSPWPRRRASWSISGPRCSTQPSRPWCAATVSSWR